MRAVSQPVVLSGDLAIYGAPAVRLALDSLQGPGVVDMRDVRYLDCSALTELARVARRVGLRDVTLLVASANVRRCSESSSPRICSRSLKSFVQSMKFVRWLKRA